VKETTKSEVSDKKILIVDDEAEFRRTLRNFVESVGYTCTEAASSRLALELLTETPFPIVISEILMPEMDGFELLHIIKKKYPDVDVLIIGGYEGKYSPMKILQAGANDILAKPFTMEQLAVQLFKIEREKALKNKLYFSAITDELTGLYNRRCFYQKLERDLGKAKEKEYPISIIMVDVDGFKRFNDRYGHLKGDALLKTVGSVLWLSIRENLDCAFRYGGDEFVMILPEADHKTALSIGNRLKANFKETAPAGLTLSMGVAQFEKDFDTEAFVQLVDERMYKDKQKSKELGHSQLEVDLGKDNYYIRCLSCGSLAHWASPLCENCLADPRKKPVSEKSQGLGWTFPKKAPHPVKDRRKAPRMRISKTFLHDGLQATIQNVSREGIQIKTRAPLSVGEPLTIALALERRILRFGGTIVYVSPLPDGSTVAGLRFFEISGDDAILLNDFLDSHLPKRRAQNKTDQVKSG
jgi:diguanylate cyclase (GGDEF)-like protein